MAVPHFAHGIQSSFLATMTERAQAAKAMQTVAVTPQVQAAQVAQAAHATQSGGGQSFFDDVLDVINPLQHLPVVSTIYRAITGDKIGDVEQVAGDTLYGGLIGLGSSIANLIFKDVTGKSLGDTVLAWAEDAVGQTAVAEAMPQTAQPAAQPQRLAATKAASQPQQPAPATSGIPLEQVASAAPATQGQDQPVRATPAALFSEPLMPRAVMAQRAQRTQPAATATAAASPRPKPTMPAPTKTAMPAQATAMLSNPNAFMAMLAAKGIDPSLGMRALGAYQKSLGLGAD